MEFIENNETIMSLLNPAYDTMTTNLDTWIKNTLLPSMQNIVSGAAIGVLNVVTVAKNLIIGIIVAVLNQLLIRSGREDQAMMTTLAGLVVVLSILVKQISALFVTIKSLFSL